MTDSPAAEPASAVTSAGFAKGWVLGLFLAAGVAWLLMTVAPLQARLPAELVGVDMYSPQPLQDKAAEIEPVVAWKNSVLRLGYAGLCLGLIPPLFAGWSSGKHLAGAALLGGVSGAALGAAAGHFGLMARRYFDSGVELSLDPIMIDSLQFMSVTILVCIPIALTFLASHDAHRWHKALSVLLGGAVAGVLVPIASAVLPSMSTHEFPPRTALVSGVWLGCLAVTVSVVAIGTGRRDNRQRPADSDAAAS